MAVILVVDDDADMRYLVVKRLAAEGYEVHEAVDGEAGYELAVEREPDLVILDWMMPRLSGLELCRQLRIDPALAATPVLMVTSRATPTDRDLGEAAGASSMLAKPFKSAELLAVVRELLEGPDSVQMV